MFELLFGYVEPISALECRLWVAYWTVKQEIEDKSSKKKSGTDNSLDGATPKMLGQSE